MGTSEVSSLPYSKYGPNIIRSDKRFRTWYYQHNWNFVMGGLLLQEISPLHAYEYVYYILFLLYVYG